MSKTHDLMGEKSMTSDLNRRHFLKTASLGIMALSMFNSNSHANEKELLKDRIIARRRKRRIIMNNDGNDFAPPWPDNPDKADEFLNKRTTPLVGSQVDSIFYCTGVFNFYKHPSTETELFRGWLGVDPLKIMIDYCKKNKFEIFWSVRMNDTHDSGSSVPLCEWKKEHPEYLVGKRGDKFPYGCNRWSSVNYGLKQVRNKVYRILRDVCTRYDIDGLELDFFRHPVLFKPQMTGEPVTQAQCDKMTGLLLRIRKMTVEMALKKKHPILISIRIPDSVGYCKALGIDLVKWLEEDLLDIIVGGGYFKLEPWENLAELGHKYNVPVYACLVKRRIQSAKEPEGKTEIHIWRGEALNAWRAGVDGLYTFNRFNPRDQIFREIGDPELLETLERVNQTAYVNEDCWSRPETWLKDGRDYMRR
jgi:hypothetical protein